MERLLSIPECAERGNWSTRFVRKLVATGRFGPRIVRVGRSVRVLESEFCDWLAAGCPNVEKFRRAIESERGGAR